MVKNTKSKQIGHKIFTGHQILASIFGVTVNHVSRVLTGDTKKKRLYLDELENYEKNQRAYIKKRQIILGINKK